MKKNKISIFGSWGYDDTFVSLTQSPHSTGCEQEHEPGGGERKTVKTIKQRPNKCSQKSESLNAGH